MSSKISQDTVMPLSLIWIFLGLVASGAIWMTKIDFTTSAYAERQKEVDSSFSELSSQLRSIDRRLSGIEGEIKRIRR